MKFTDVEKNLCSAIYLVLSESESGPEIAQLILDSCISAFDQMLDQSPVLVETLVNSKDKILH